MSEDTSQDPVSQLEENEEKILRIARAKALNNLTRNPSSQNVDAYQKATRIYEECLLKKARSQGEADEKVLSVWGEQLSLVSNDKFRQLLPKVSQEHREILLSLEKSLQNNLDRSRKNTSEQAVRKLSKSRRAFEKTVDELWDRYFVHDRMFKNRLEVLDYLQDLGYSVKKSKLYDDCRSGLLRLQPDKSILESAVKDYIRHPDSGLVKAAEAGETKASEDLARENLKLDVEHKRVRNEEARFKFDREKGRYLPREDFEMELSSRAAVLDSGLRHAVTVNVAELIEMVGGRQDKRDGFLQAFQELLDAQLNRFASTRTFQVMFLEPEESEEPNEEESHEPDAL
jgi:hypothetical protein